MEEKVTRLDNPKVQRENRIRCAVGEQGDPRVPSFEELVRMLDYNAEVDVDTSDL